MAGKYDVLLRGGVVVDPRNKVNGYLDIGVSGGQVVEVGTGLSAAAAEDTIELDGYTMMPGVIDTHTHVRGGAQRMMVRAGVCTALDMGSMRDVIKEFPKCGCGMNIAGLQQIGHWPADPPSREEVARLIAAAVEDGAVGIKVLGIRPSTPAATEILIEAANRAGVYVACHAGTTSTGSNLNGFLEAISLAGDNCLHVCHVNTYFEGQVKDPEQEALEGLAALKGKQNLVSESHLAAINSAGGQIGPDGFAVTPGVRSGLQARGYTPDRKGLEAAIVDGVCFVQVPVGGVTELRHGDEGLAYWRSVGTDVSVSFPVSRRESTFLCAMYKDDQGAFVVDAISTDGGVAPRNVAVEYGLCLVRYRALTLEEFVHKTSTAGAAMLGLKDKGHLGVGADADVTVLDMERGRAVMTIVGGKVVMAHGVVCGSGGTIITTPRGEAKVKSAGLRYQIVHPEDMLLYSKRG